MRISGPAAVPAPPYQPLSEWVNARSWCRGDDHDEDEESGDDEEDEDNSDHDEDEESDDQGEVGDINQLNQKLIMIKVRKIHYIWEWEDDDADTSKISPKWEFPKSVT